MSMNVSSAALDTKLTPVELALLVDLQRLAQVVRLHGYACRAYSPKSVVTLMTLPLAKKELLAKQLQSVLNIVLQTPEIETPSSDHPERCYVEQALKMYNLELRDDYWAKLEKDDVIEMYSSEDIQLFRTFNFFKISSYSLLDLLTNEWYHLWERPSFVMDALIQAAGEMMEGKMQKTAQIKAARHILKEIYHDNSIDFKSSSVLVEPGMACPLYDKGSNEVKGFLFSLRGKVIGYDNDADKIAMI